MFEITFQSSPIAPSKGDTPWINLNRKTRSCNILEIFEERFIFVDSFFIHNHRLDENEHENGAEVNVGSGRYRFSYPVPVNSSWLSQVMWYPLERAIQSLQISAQVIENLKVKIMELSE